jgi:hypothetical protein
MRKALLSCALAVAWVPALVAGQDLNITRPAPELERMLGAAPMRIVSAEISRPKAKGDITLKADIAFGDEPPLRVKLRKAEPGADDFNNVPRYDLAAYELQKLLVDAPEYPVPPTALRFVPIAEFRRYTDEVKPTFRGSDEVLAVVQYWLQEVKLVEDVLDPARFATDPVYARHIGQLNVFTYLIDHKDSNLGNFLISRAEKGPRVFSIDHGVAFASPDSDRGELWRSLRVDRLPADTVARLRALTREELEARLGVLAQWRLVEGRFVAEPPGANLAQGRGVRVEDGVVQMGLSSREIGRVWQRREQLLRRVDEGKVSVW